MVKHPDSINKLFQYFDRLEGIYPVYLNPLFFRKLVCPEKCGACCRHIFTMDWFVRDSVPYSCQTLERRVTYHGIEIPVFTVPPDPKLKQCVFLDEAGRCRIHKSKPLTCQIEPIKFWLAGDEVAILKRKFARGHQFTRVNGEKGALCMFTEYDKVAWRNDISVLSRFVSVGELFHVRLTAIRRLLEYLDLHEAEVCGGYIPPRTPL
jgi:Fe-S-cluster containining protein